MLGVAVDPAFADNRFIYVYYTFRKFGTCANNSPTSPVNRVSRFVLGPANTVDPATETVLIDNSPSPGHHNSGDLQFGRDATSTSASATPSPSTARAAATRIRATR